MELLLIGDIFLCCLAFIALVIASITDIRKREVPNWLSFSIIAIAFAVRAIFSVISLSFSYFFYGLIVFFLFFLICNLLYYGKFFGGGDAKMIIGLATIFATTPSFFKNSFFLFDFLINIFVIGSVYSLIFILFLIAKNRKAFSSELKKINKKMKKAKIFFFLFVPVFLILSVLLSYSVIFIALAITFLLFPYLYIFVKAAENASMIKRVHPKNLTEGDWLAKEVKIKNKIIKPSVHGLSLEDIAIIKKHKKKVLIKYGIPFVPALLIALVLTFLFGNLLLALIRAIFF